MSHVQKTHAQREIQIDISLNTSKFNIFMNKMLMLRRKGNGQCDPK